MNEMRVTPAKKAAAPAMKKLAAPVNLSQQIQAKGLEPEAPDWAKIAEKPTLVDSDRLEAYEAKREKKFNVSHFHNFSQILF